MTDLRQAAQAVVERWDTPAWEWRDQGPTADLIAALRKALEQPEQEPTCPECKAAVLYECVACSSNNYPPAAQRPWQGLTDEEITEIYEMGLGVRASIETALDKLEERNT